MPATKLHAPKLPGLLQALLAASLIATLLGVLHHTVGIPVGADTAVTRLSVNTQVVGLLVVSAVHPEAAVRLRRGEVDGMSAVGTSDARAYRMPVRMTLLIGLGNLAVLTLLFYLPIRRWHDIRYRRRAAPAV